MPLISSLRRPRQEDCVCQAILAYKLSAYPRKQSKGPGEMAQPAKGLLCKRGDRSSDP